MSTLNSPPPHNLASAVHQYVLDPALTDDAANIFATAGDSSDPQLDAVTIDAINATLQAAASTQVQEAVLVAPGPSTKSNKRKHVKADPDPTALVGSEANPIIDPPPHEAPHNKPDRNEYTPDPLYLQFSSRGNFDIWMEGESSWCHFVQRRLTTPAMRAEERARSRRRIREKKHAALPLEEQTQQKTLKHRRRMRTSTVLQKVTFTCHHAGSYNTKHSTDLPKEKLRLNTKKSVKCGCTARVVCTENQNGLCKVLYSWRHEGHESHGAEEFDSGRLPKAVDEWIKTQIDRGSDMDDLRRALSLTEAERADYIARITADPNLIDPDLPPPVAYTTKISYPDIYNRYRKLKGPVKASKIPKVQKRKRVNPAPALETDPGAVDAFNDLESVGPESFLSNAVEGLGDEQLAAELAKLTDNGHSDFAQALLRHAGGEGQTHDLAEALLRLPRGEAQGNEVHEAWTSMDM